MHAKGRSVVNSNLRPVCFCFPSELVCSLMQEIHVLIKHNLKYYEVFRLDFGARKQYDNHLAKESFLSLNLISCTNSDRDRISFVGKTQPSNSARYVPVFSKTCSFSTCLYSIVFTI